MTSGTTTEYTDESGEQKSVLTSIENQSDIIPNGQESGDDSDSEEIPSFPFGYRGKQVVKASGDDSKTKKRPKELAKAQEAEELAKAKAKEAKGKRKDGKK